MIADYAKYLPLLNEKLEQIGFEQNSENDFVATFSCGDGWQVIFEGDRHVRPSISLFIKPPEANETYSVRLLMDVWREKYNSEVAAPSLANQLDFLIAHSGELFKSPFPFADEYREINEVI